MSSCPLRSYRWFLLLSVCLSGGTLSLGVTVSIDFEALPLDGVEFYNGSDGAGGFGSYGTWFNNEFDDFGGGCCWNGWSYSRVVDPNTPGFVNQYAAFPGAGAEGSEKYGVAFSGFDGGAGIIPEVTLPNGAEPGSVQIANTTYAVLSMLQGDSFAKQFGGPSGNDPDWFLLKVQGLNAAGTVVGSVPTYLADYRFADPNDDFILADWQALDLSPLAGLGVAKLTFRLSSSDTGIFGMNTPAYVAVDNLALEVAAMPGDFDLSGSVGAADLAIWEANYGVSQHAGFTSGDANEDGNVDGGDFLAWQANLGNGSTTLHSVPEPGTCYAVWVLATTGCLVRLRPQIRFKT